MPIWKKRTLPYILYLPWHGYAVDMPSQSGAHTYRFRVHSGDIEIQHHSYDGIAGLWCLPPESGDRASIVLHSGEEAIITIGQPCSRL